MKFITQFLGDGADIDITTLQNMANNDQYLYEEVVRRPRGIIAYAEMGGKCNSKTLATNGAPITNWTDIRNNANTQTLVIDADVEANRMIKVELYIPALETRGPSAPFTFGPDGPVGFSWGGIRLVRDESVLGVPIGNHYWGTVNEDMRSFYMTSYDFPDAGRHTYSAQWKNNNMFELTGGSIVIVREDPFNVSPAPIPPAQLIIKDMGSVEGLDVPEGVKDKRNRDNLTSVDTSIIVRNQRRVALKRKQSGL